MTAASLRCTGFGADGALEGGPELTRHNPGRTDEIVGTLVTSGAAGTVAAIDGAEGARRQWAATAVEDRVSMLRAGAGSVAATADRLAPVLARELGKPIADSAGEMGFAAAFLDFVCDHVAEVCADRVIDDAAGRVVLVSEPYGVISAVVPWNAPLILSALKVAPALATGNVIVVKPSPIAPFAVTAALAALAAHLPPGVLSVVHGEAEVGSALVSHPAVRKVAFTGGSRVASDVLHSCAETLTPTLMELGGNDAALVLDDLTFTDDVMERLVFGVYLTSGQVCMAAKRLYVPQRRLDAFVEAFRATADRVLVCGDPLDPDVTIGPVATAGQRDRVERLVDDARSNGATVIELGTITSDWNPGRGHFVRPTLVVGAHSGAAIVDQEQFGPTVPVLGYASLDDAIRSANDSDSGLGSSVWSDDSDEAFTVGRRLEAGMTFINCHNRAGMALRVPFGGVKHSGSGREFGVEGIGEYVQTHALHLPGAIRDSVGGEGPRGNAYPTG